jgi:hypothetical protein
MKILTLHSSHLRSEAHYQFYLLLQKLYGNHPNVEAIVASLMAKFDELISLEGTLVDAVKGSKYTEKIEEADSRIDRDIVGINSVIDSGLHHYDPQVVEAAKALAVRMKSFRGEIEKKAYEEESAAVKILVKDFQTTYSEQVSIVGLDNWITELSGAQSSFEELFIKRNKELAGRPQQKLTKVRSEVDTVYRNMVSLITAYTLLNGEDSTIEFIEELNREITYFNEHSHHRQRHDIKNAFVDSIPDQKFKDEPVIYLPKVSYDDNQLVFTKDYDLLYKNNERPGTASIIIKGKGHFKGETIVRFNIIA